MTSSTLAWLVVTGIVTMGLVAMVLACGGTG